MRTIYQKLTMGAVKRIVARIALGMFPVPAFVLGAAGRLSFIGELLKNSIFFSRMLIITIAFVVLLNNALADKWVAHYLRAVAAPVLEHLDTCDNSMIAIATRRLVRGGLTSLDYISDVMQGNETETYDYENVMTTVRRVMTIYQKMISTIVDSIVAAQSAVLQIVLETSMFMFEKTSLNSYRLIPALVVVYFVHVLIESLLSEANVQTSRLRNMVDEHDGGDRAVNSSTPDRPLKARRQSLE